MILHNFEIVARPTALMCSRKKFTRDAERETGEIQSKLIAPVIYAPRWHFVCVTSETRGHLAQVMIKVYEHPMSVSHFEI
jgi:hypothetical protein